MDVYSWKFSTFALRMPVGAGMRVLHLCACARDVSVRIRVPDSVHVHESRGLCHW
jgi:hypothetical protein